MNFYLLWGGEEERIKILLIKLHSREVVTVKKKTFKHTQLRYSLTQYLHNVVLHKYFLALVLYWKSAT